MLCRSMPGEGASPRPYRAAIDACADQAPELFLELSDWAEQCHAEDLARPEAIPGGADTDCPEDEALIASPFSLEDESPLFQAAPHGPDAAVHILGEAAKRVRRRSWPRRPTRPPSSGWVDRPRRRRPSKRWSPKN